MASLEELEARVAALEEHGRMLAEQGRAIVNLDQKMADGFATLNTGMTRITELLDRLAGPEQA